MRNVPGWVMGAAGAGMVASAFVLGGRLAASDATPVTPSALTADAAGGLQLECEPGQRAVLRQASLACVGMPTVPAGYVGYGEPFAAARPAGYVQTVNRPAVVTRSAPVARTSTARAPATQTRSTKKSVAIIAGSAAAGAVVGGVAKGKKGAVIGGIVAGAAGLFCAASRGAVVAPLRSHQVDRSREDTGGAGDNDLAVPPDECR